MLEERTRRPAGIAPARTAHGGAPSPRAQKSSWLRIRRRNDILMTDRLGTW